MKRFIDYTPSSLTLRLMKYQFNEIMLSELISILNKDLEQYNLKVISNQDVKLKFSESNQEFIKYSFDNNPDLKIKIKVKIGELNYEF